jgi:1-acyl-sn-glycerol-3-phosphate acyltransferase
MSITLRRPSWSRSLAMPVPLAFFSLLFAILTLVFVPFAMRVAHWMPRTWAWLWLRMGGVRLTVRGLDGLDRRKRYAFVSNHQSGLDIPILYVALGRFRLSFMSKKELMMIPVFGWGMAAIGHIAVDRGNARKAHTSIAKAVDQMKRGHNCLAIFPEGTRSADGQLQPFKTGVFNLALEMGVELVPVTIQGANEVLRKKSQLYRPGPVTVTVGTPISTEGISRTDKRDVAQQLHDTIAAMLDAEG